MQALTGFPSGNGSNPSAYRPNRGPNIIADANADEPPTNFQKKNTHINIVRLFQILNSYQLNEPITKKR